MMKITFLQLLRYVANEKTIMKYVEQNGYRVIIIDEIENPENDNIDVEVRFPDQRRYSASVFTLKNIQSLMTNYQETGECNDGQYFWCSDLFIVRDLHETTILDAIRHLIQEDELHSAFKLLENDNDYDYWLDREI